MLAYDFRLVRSKRKTRVISCETSYLHEAEQPYLESIHLTVPLNVESIYVLSMFYNHC